MMGETAMKIKKTIALIVVLAIIMGLTGCGGNGSKKTEGTLTIYLVRHGQTDTNVQGLLVGQSGDPQLTEEGRENAKKVGEALSSVQFDATYSSELTRAYDTACLLLQGADEEMTVEKVAEFNDISWGDAEGMTWESVSKEYSVADMEQCFGAIDDSTFISPMNAESKYDFCNRFSQGIDKVIANQKPGDTVLVVAHSSLAFYLQRLFPEQGISGVDNTSVTIITYDYKTDEFSLERLNDTSYLEN